MALTYNRSQETADGLYYFSRLQLLATETEPDRYYFEWHKKKFWIQKSDVVMLEHVTDTNDWTPTYYTIHTTQTTARSLIEDLAYRYPTPHKSRKAQPSPTTTTRPQKHKNSISEKEKERLRLFWSQS
jgi:hypothetical protein